MVRFPLEIRGAPDPRGARKSGSLRPHAEEEWPTRRADGAVRGRCRPPSTPLGRGRRGWRDGPILMLREGALKRAFGKTQ